MVWNNIMWKELLRNKDWLRTLVCNWITNQVVYDSLLSRPCTACRTCLVCSTRHRTPSPCPPALGHSRPRRSRSSGRCDSCWTCFCHSASSRGLGEVDVLLVWLATLHHGRLVLDLGAEARVAVHGAVDRPLSTQLSGPRFCQLINRN